MRLVRLAAVTVFTAVGVAGLHGQQTVEPGRVFPGPRLDIRAPLSAGWRLTRSNNDGLTFARSDAMGRTALAEVRVMTLTSDRQIRDLVEFARMLIERRTGAPPRFQDVDIQVTATSEREYPCVRSRASVLDTQARTLEGMRSLPIMARDLVCLVPGEPDLLVNISYVQRGGLADDAFETEAATFIDGVKTK
jgi:hypothetical protein